MFKKLVAVAILVAIPTSAMAGSSGGIAGTSLHMVGGTKATTQAKTLKGFKSAHGSGAERKSERQKCLDKLLPQDGVDCLKKLKAKKK